MEFLDGPGLNSLIIGRSKLLDGNRLALARQAAEAWKPCTRRDLFIATFAREIRVLEGCHSLKLIDFGLTLPAEKEFMLPGNRTGTPNYMAPEVVRRKSTDQRLDIFAYGVSMYELFAFELPWQRGDTGQAAMTHGQSAPTPLRTFYPKINPTLEAAIHKCMESEPESRFQTITQYLKAISRVKHEDA